MFLDEQFMMVHLSFEIMIASARSACRGVFVFTILLVFQIGCSRGPVAPSTEPEPEPEALRPEDLAPLLAAEIGYEVVGRGTATAILAGFVAGVLALGVWLRRSRAPERIGLYGPGIAVAAAGVFVAVGATSRGTAR